MKIRPNTDDEITEMMYDQPQGDQPPMMPVDQSHESESQNEQQSKREKTHKSKPESIEKQGYLQTPIRNKKNRIRSEWENAH